MESIKFYKKKFITSGIASYKDVDEGVLLINKNVIDKALKTLIKKPVVITHEGEEAVGEVVDAYFSPEQDAFICGFNVWNKVAQDLLDNKNFSISCTYNILKQNDKGGIYHNIPYDVEAEDIEFINIAIVEEPRYQEAREVLNGLKGYNRTNLEEKSLNDTFINNSKKEMFFKKKVKNGVDKRHLIDEVGGMLDGKVSEELWRTIIGKLEQIAYNPSEDDKRDNDIEEEVKVKEEDDDRDYILVDGEKLSYADLGRVIVEEALFHRDRPINEEEEEEEIEIENSCVKNEVKDELIEILKGKVDDRLLKNVLEVVERKEDEFKDELENGCGRSVRSRKANEEKDKRRLFRDFSRENRKNDLEEDARETGKDELEKDIEKENKPVFNSIARSFSNSYNVNNIKSKRDRIAENNKKYSL